MKRFLALALSLLMLFSLVACSGNTAPAADADNTQQTEATAPETPRQRGTAAGKHRNGHRRTEMACRRHFNFRYRSLLDSLQR